MKKVIIFFILTAVLLSSCTRDVSVDEMLLEKADEVYQTATVMQFDEYVGDYAPETEYSLGDISNINGIRYYYGYYNALKDGKYYFDVNSFQTRTNEDGTQNQGTATITQSMNLETGESFYLCPDPLCMHPYRVCEYTNLNCVGYYNGELYYRRQVVDFNSRTTTHTIERLDTTTGSFTVVFSQTEKSDDAKREYLSYAKIVGDRLFYNITVSDMDPEAKTETQSTVRYVLDLADGVTETLPDQDMLILYVSEDRVYGYSDEYGSIVRMDSEYLSPVTISSPEGFPDFGDMQADENTGEIFVLMMEPDRKYGVLCKIVGDVMEIQSMPHDKITKFQLTRDEFYYSAYDPVEIGKGARSGETVTLDDGGKIYVTDRVTRENAALIFSDGVDFNMRDWFVLGDNLYLDSVLRVNEGGSVYFAPSRSLKHVRINLANKTVRYFRFD